MLNTLLTFWTKFNGRIGQVVLSSANSSIPDCTCAIIIFWKSICVVSLFRWYYCYLIDLLIL